MKTVTRYDLRYYPSPTAYSKRVGFKARLLPYREAVKVVRKLKKMGVDAFYSKMEINVWRVIHRPTFRKLMKTKIHINQHNIRLRSKGVDVPVITSKTYKSNTKGNTATIYDKDGVEVARVIYSDKPLACGARCWVETKNIVIVK